MPIYNYKAKDRYGVPVQGMMEASASSSVASRLTEMGYTPVYIIEQEISTYSSLEEFFARFTRIKSEDLLVFVRQLSSILSAGVPLLESLEAVYVQVTSYRFKRIILKIRMEI